MTIPTENRIGERASTCGCGVTLGLKNTSGRCKSCNPKAMARDPEIRRHQREGIRRKMADPAYYAEHVARCIANGKKLTPEQRERRREHGRSRASALIAAAARLTPEDHARKGRKRSDTVLAWCPPQWRDIYRDLKKRGRRAAIAKAIVLDMIAGRPVAPKWAHQKAQLAWCLDRWRSRYNSLRSGHGAAEAKRRVLSEIDTIKLKTADPLIAADFVRKISPINRCDERGAFKIGGDFWRYGSRVLSRTEVVALALRKGWQPDAWRRLAA